jgi:hypothetical protein
VNRLLAIATNLFPIWVLLGGALALAHPGWFTWFGDDLRLFASGLDKVVHPIDHQ